MGLFGRKKEEKVIIKSSERIIMEQLKNDDDEYITALAKQMMNGAPLILNFDALHVDRANKAIAFISGVVYAISGHIVEINETTYLFGSKDLYQDGSIEEWLRTNLT
ncbi:cell division protein SepF [Acholeplasma oculi]|uniref:Cell division protein SepF n=1 Tax=Acholeplasma oculi TaxID=35623 RepID=A0A061ABQ7_9MOLU|nr:cell division protein SepF [Acholeplasma oculi]CDR30844.1 Cell division protein SepF [Acholeplasma oculi]SKC35228.1 cell division inhibitor SepF [Acholeplasma oculi]